MTRIVGRALAYLWASPVTAVGLLLAGIAVLSRGSLRRVDGVLEVSGGFLERALGPIGEGRLVIYAITLGHVVLASTTSNLDRTRRHERVHVRQYERLGPFFPVCYFASSVRAWWKGRDPYFENSFEREAFLEEFDEPPRV